MPDGVTKYRRGRCYGGNTKACRLEILQLAFCLGKRIVQLDGRNVDVELCSFLSYVATSHRRIALDLGTAILPFLDLVNLQKPDDPQDGGGVLHKNSRDRGRCNPNILLMGARSGSVPDDCCGRGMSPFTRLRSEIITIEPVWQKKARPLQLLAPFDEEFCWEGRKLTRQDHGSIRIHTSMISIDLAFWDKPDAVDKFLCRDLRFEHVVVDIENNRDTQPLCHAEKPK